MAGASSPPFSLGSVYFEAAFKQRNMLASLPRLQVPQGMESLEEGGWSLSGW